MCKCFLFVTILIFIAAFCSGYSNPILNLLRSIPPMLLIFAVLHCLVIPVLSVPNSVINLGVQTLHCTGQLSKLTHDDCHGIFFSNETACFLDPFNEKYIPCAKVCNNVMRDTAGERRCKDRCQSELFQPQITHSFYFRS